MKKAAVIGSLNYDTSLTLERMPQPGETIPATGITLNPGGKGANQAAALAKLGCSVWMAGAVGRDAPGDALLESLERAGVNCSHVARREEPTGQAFITVDRAGENSIVILAGANGKVTPAQVESHRELLAQVDCLVMQLEIPLDAVLAGAKLAAALGKLVVLDPAPAPGPLPRELLSLCGLIKPNETELHLLTGLPTATPQECQAAACRLLDQGVKAVLVSLGSRGAMAVTEEGFRLAPAYPVKAVDSTSAGDCFTAAFLARWQGGYSLPELEDALRYANAAAALTVGRRGAQSSIPTRDEVERLFSGTMG